MNNVFYGPKHMKHFCVNIVNELHLQNFVIKKAADILFKV